MSIDDDVHCSSLYSDFSRRDRQNYECADFESGNLIQKAKAMVPLLVLRLSAFRRATDLAMAMKPAVIGAVEGRTKIKPLKYASRDRIAYAVFAGYVALVLFLRMAI